MADNVNHWHKVATEHIGKLRSILATRYLFENKELQAIVSMAELADLTVDVIEAYDRVMASQDKKDTAKLFYALEELKNYKPSQ